MSCERSERGFGKKCNALKCRQWRRLPIPFLVLPEYTDEAEGITISGEVRRFLVASYNCETGTGTAGQILLLRSRGVTQHWSNLSPDHTKFNVLDYNFTFLETLQRSILLPLCAIGSMGDVAWREAVQTQHKSRRTAGEGGGTRLPCSSSSS